MQVHETDNWPFVEAKWYQRWTGPTKRRPVRVIGIHSMEYTERADAAEIIAHDFATREEDNKGSAHICVDNNSIVQCVRDNDVAYAIPNVNRDGIHIELAGYAKQSEAQWLDPYGVALLALGADAAAQYCLKYDIPPVHLTDDELRGGKKGLIGHVQATRVYPRPGGADHQDPGPNFPWTYFMGHVQSAFNARKAMA
jgi:N-acetyl-anhydromuramyl-L-alanine amidase AmpD